MRPISLGSLLVVFNPNCVTAGSVLHGGEPDGRRRQLSGASAGEGPQQHHHGGGGAGGHPCPHVDWCVKWWLMRQVLIGASSVGWCVKCWLVR